MCDIIDKHSSRERKTKDPTDGESRGFQANEESKHNIISKIPTCTQHLFKFNQCKKCSKYAAFDDIKI